MIFRLLCRLGIHIKGPWLQTRYNPALNFYTDHRRCECGRSEHRFVHGDDIPKGWTSMDLPPGVKASATPPISRSSNRR